MMRKMIRVTMMIIPVHLITMLIIKDNDGDDDKVDHDDHLAHRVHLHPHLHRLIGLFIEDYDKGDQDHTSSSDHCFVHQR